MPTAIPFPIRSTPGIKRDGTSFEGDNYQDGLWCRFNARGLPRKIAGYLAITSRLPEVIRGMDSYTAGKVCYVYMGSQSVLTQVQVGLGGLLGPITDRTPIGFVADANNLWQFANFQNVVSGNSVIVAHANRALSDISDQTETPIYYGNSNDVAALVASGMSATAGGVMAIPPYIVAYGKNGRVDISKANDPTVATANSIFVTPQKIIKGLPLRGSNLAFILWSLDSIITAQFDPNLTSTAGGIPTFNFNTVSASSSILSEQGVVEYDSIYYWAGVDRFLMFNGIQQELPNNLSIDFFYDNVNMAARNKVFAYKVPRWGEIWWCFPRGSATECNHAVIYNTRLKIWYDTPLPDAGRSAGIYAKVYPKPFMADLDHTNQGYTLWQHETGVDKSIYGSTLAIRSFIQTHELSPITRQPEPADKAYRVSIVEPDFKQAGNINVSVTGRANSRTTEVATAPEVMPQTVAGPETQIARFSKNGRLISFIFETNQAGGDMEMGQVIGHLDQTDGRITS